MDDAVAELGKSEGRIIHHVSGQTTGLRFTEHSLLTELLMGIIVKKDGKPIWSSVLSNHYHRRTEFTENISNSRIIFIENPVKSRLSIWSISRMAILQCFYHI